MKKALGYIRVSSKVQASDGNGLLDQSDAIKAWAERNGYEIVEWFEDVISGELAWDKRPAMRGLVERLAVNGIEAVLVHQIDRITRGKSEIFDGFVAMVEASEVQVISVVDGLLTADPKADEFQNIDRDMFLKFKVEIVRAEKRKLVARMTLGRMRAKAEGRRICGEYFYGTDPRRPDEVATLARMRELRADGLSCYAIAKQLSVEGLNPRKAAKWSPNGVAKILERVVPSAAQVEPQTQKPR
jgi:DNA invertase Pin-like site-specific DNA recombinase